MIYTYFDIPIAQREGGGEIKARFRRNRFTRTVWVWQFNVCPEGNYWATAPNGGRGYGWGRWKRV